MSKLTTHHRIALLAILNYTTYSGWTLLNKSLFTQHADTTGTSPRLPAPLLCTAFQMFVAFVIAYVLVVLCRVQRSPGVDLMNRALWWERIVPLGTSRAVDIGCGNYALSLVSVALQQVVKATLPVFVSILSIVVLRKRISHGMVMSLLPIVVGTIVASVPSTVTTSQSTAISSAGVMLALMSCFGRAAKAVLNALLLTGASNSKLRPMEIVLLEAPTTCLLMLVPAIVLEGRSVLWDGNSLLNVHPGASLLYNILAGTLMFLTQVAYVSLIDASSALTCQVLMSLKMLVLIFFSVWLFHTPFSFVNGCGVVLSGIGCGLYAMAAQRQQVAERSKKHDDDTNSSATV